MFLCLLFANSPRRLPCQELGKRNLQFERLVRRGFLMRKAPANVRDLAAPVAYLWPWLLLGALTVAQSARGQEMEAFGRDAVVQRLREAEDQIHSGEALFEEIKLPTSPNMIPLIKELCEREGNSLAVPAYIVGKEAAQSASRKVHWRRLGLKERFDSIPLEQEKEHPRTETRAFNGEFVRWIFPGADRPRASIQSLEGSHWKTENRIQPFSLIYQFQDVPYSDLIARSPTYLTCHEVIGGKKYSSIEFQHPDKEGMTFQLLFDHRFRLFERRLIFQDQKDKPARVGETHRFSEWELFENKTGEPVELPSQAVYKYFLGVHPNGTPVEYTQTEMEITDLVLNLPLSDAVFLPEILVRAEVFDGISGLGTLQPGHRPDHLFPEDAESRWWWIKALGVCALVGLLVGVAVYRRNRLARSI